MGQRIGVSYGIFSIENGGISYLDQQILVCISHPERFIMEPSGKQTVTQRK